MVNQANPNSIFSIIQFDNLTICCQVFTKTFVTYGHITAQFKTTDIINQFCRTLKGFTIDAGHCICHIEDTLKGRILGKTEDIDSKEIHTDLLTSQAQTLVFGQVLRGFHVKLTDTEVVLTGRTSSHLLIRVDVRMLVKLSCQELNSRRLTNLNINKIIRT